MKKVDPYGAIRIFGMVAALVVLVAAGFWMHHFYGEISFPAWRSFLETMGFKGVLVYIALFCLGVAFFVPATPMAVAGGLVFGPWSGFIILESSSVIVAIFIFVLVRFCIGPIFGMQRMRSFVPQKILARAQDNAFLMIVYARTLKVNAGVICYGASSLDIRLRDYILATILGSVPNNLAVVLFAGVGHDAILDGAWVSLLQWELIPAILLTGINLFLAHRMNPQGCYDQDNE
ncbi:MAG: VTT domain-containing protein [Thermodesulfobacteriota bacterium]|nr:VTT domain-containing protein [Thermodesulfobacteriota bacterium]